MAFEETETCEICLGSGIDPYPNEVLNRALGRYCPTCGGTGKRKPRTAYPNYMPTEPILPRPQLPESSLAARPVSSGETVILKNAQEIEGVRRACVVAVDLLKMLKNIAKPGITTEQLDKSAAQFLRAHSAQSSYLGYARFPASIITSINDEIIDGIPSQRVLHDGDLLKLNVGVLFKGWIASNAITLPIGTPKRETMQLREVARQACKEGVAAARTGGHLGDIGYAIQHTVEMQGLNVVREYGGSGIGRSKHENPSVPGFGIPGSGMSLRSGMVLYITAIVNAGSPEVNVHSNRRTIVTLDGSLSAMFGHTVAITTNEPDILTDAHL